MRGRYVCDLKVVFFLYYSGTRTEEMKAYFFQFICMLDPGPIFNRLENNALHINYIYVHRDVRELSKM